MLALVCRQVSVGMTTLFPPFVLAEYFTDLEGRGEQDPTLHWDFYSSSLFGKFSTNVGKQESPPVWRLEKVEREAPTVILRGERKTS